MKIIKSGEYFLIIRFLYNPGKKYLKKVINNIIMEEFPFKVKKYFFKYLKMLRVKRSNPDNKNYMLIIFIPLFNSSQKIIKEEFIPDIFIYFMLNNFNNGYYIFFSNEKLFCYDININDKIFKYEIYDYKVDFDLFINNLVKFNKEKNRNIYFILEKDSNDSFLIEKKVKENIGDKSKIYFLRNKGLNYLKGSFLTFYLKKINIMLKAFFKVGISGDNFIFNNKSLVLFKKFILTIMIIILLIININIANSIKNYKKKLSIDKSSFKKINLNIKNNEKLLSKIDLKNYNAIIIINLILKKVDENKDIIESINIENDKFDIVVKSKNILSLLKNLKSIKNFVNVEINSTIENVKFNNDIYSKAVISGKYVR